MSNYSHIDLEKMVEALRVTELAQFLSYCNRNKGGKKAELLERAREVVRNPEMCSQAVQTKLVQLYRSIYAAPSGRRVVTGLNMAPPPQPTMDYRRMERAAAGHQSAHHMYASHRSMQQSQQMVMQGGGYTAQQQHNAVAAAAAHAALQQQQYNKIMAHNAMGNVIPSIPHPFSQEYPHHPDVTYVPLPFYDKMAELIKPTSLMAGLSNSSTAKHAEALFQFHLTPAQAHSLAQAPSRMSQNPRDLQYGVQIQLRFCLLETTCPQEDNFPPQICVRVNSKMVSLPNVIPTNKAGVEPKRPNRPVNITPQTRISPTVGTPINVSWAPDMSKSWVIAVFLVDKIASVELLQRLRTKGVRNADFSKALIREKLTKDLDCEVESTTMKVSLLCPLGKTLITVPCRGKNCQHLQCFDASLFLQMNERKPTWTCPVCDIPCPYHELAVDGYMLDVLKKCPSHCTDIVVLESGDWEPAVDEKGQSLSSRKVVDSKMVTLDQSILEIDSSPSTPANSTTTAGSKLKANGEEPELICLDSSSDDENIALAMLKKKKKKKKKIQLLASSSSSSSDVDDAGSTRTLTLQDSSPQSDDTITGGGSSRGGKENGVIASTSTAAIAVPQPVPPPQPVPVALTVSSSAVSSKLGKMLFGSSLLSTKASAASPSPPVLAATSAASATDSWSIASIMHHQQQLHQHQQQQQQQHQQQAMPAATGSYDTLSSCMTGGASRATAAYQHSSAGSVFPPSHAGAPPPLYPAHSGVHWHPAAGPPAGSTLVPMASTAPPLPTLSGQQGGAGPGRGATLQIPGWAPASVTAEQPTYIGGTHNVFSGTPMDMSVTAAAAAAVPPPMYHQNSSLRAGEDFLTSLGMHRAGSNTHNTQATVFDALSLPSVVSSSHLRRTSTTDMASAARAGGAPPEKRVILDAIPPPPMLHKAGGGPSVFPPRPVPLELVKSTAAAAAPPGVPGVRPETIQLD